MIDVVGVHHIGRVVADLRASCDFYCSCGYSVLDRLHLTGPDPAIGNGLDVTTLDVAFLGSDALTLELLQFDPPGETVGFGEPAFGSVPVCAASAAAVDSDGHPVTSVSPADGVRVALTSADPAITGQLLGLLGFAPSGSASFTGHGVRIDLERARTASGPARPNQPGRMHVCCQVKDMDAACASVLSAGFSLVSTPRVSGNLQWVFVRHDEGPGIELLSVGE